MDEPFRMLVGIERRKVKPKQRKFHDLRIRSPQTDPSKLQKFKPFSGRPMKLSKILKLTLKRDVILGSHLAGHSK